MVVTQVGDLAYCGVTSASVTWTKISAIPEIINGGVICTMVVFQFVKRALEMYRVTNKWHFNRYMSLFAGQSVLYFLLCVLIPSLFVLDTLRCPLIPAKLMMTLPRSVVFFNRTAILVALGQFQTEGWGSLILLPLEYLPAFALTPRFIMSVRALHPLDSQESQSRQSRETDSGFGLPGSRHGDHRSASGMVFDIGRPDSAKTLEDVEIPMEEWRLTMGPEPAEDGV